MYFYEPTHIYTYAYRCVHGCVDMFLVQCVAVCCSVLQCVAVCRSVLQCAAVCCSVLHCVAVYCSVSICIGDRPVSMPTRLCIHLYVCIYISINMWICIYINMYKHVNMYICKYIYTYICIHIFPRARTYIHLYVWIRRWLVSDTGWRRLIGCLKLQVIFRKKASNYRSLLRKMTYIDKASYDSIDLSVYQFVCLYT